MTTYSGELYVARQLESILHQTRPADEVVICDDGSKDNTFQVVQEFIIANELSGTWRIVRNSPNLGWKNNFFKAIGMTNGDIVFFSDQDDIWMENKIEVMSTLMESHNMGCLYANKLIINEKDEPLVERQEKNVFSGKITQQKLNPSFYCTKTLGCCMCVNRRIVDSYLKVNYPQGGHDSQCGRLALLCDSLWYLDQPVIKYRIHSNNTSGISGAASFGQSTRQKRIEDIVLTINWIKRLKEVFIDDNQKTDLLEGCEHFLYKRKEYFNGNVTIIPLICGIKYYDGWSMLIGDIAYKHGCNKRMGMIRWKLK